MNKRIKKKKGIFRNDGCLGRTIGNYTDGYDFDCDYEYAGEIECDRCIYGLCKCGYNPSYPINKQKYKGENFNFELYERKRKFNTGYNKNQFIELDGWGV